MRRIAFFGLAIPAVLLAADLFAQLGWEQASFENACFQFVAHPDQLPSFSVTPAMRALAIAQRKGAVEAIGAKAKAYYASEAFKKRWAEHRGQFTSGEDQERQRAEADAKGQKMMEQSMAQMDQMMAMIPPEQQAELKKAMAKAREKKEKKAKKAEKNSGDEEGASNVPPKDPKVNLRKALQHFLAQTEGVDYGAATSPQNGRRYFANKAFEAKPEVWKMAFRAGRDASEGARTYVRTWLVELK